MSYKDLELISVPACCQPSAPAPPVTPKIRRRERLCFQLAASDFLDSPLNAFGRGVGSPRGYETYILTRLLHSSASISCSVASAVSDVRL